jgi:hypothetical protein
MGHSVGAIEAVILGLRNANVSAVIALDGTYGSEGLSTVLTHSYGYKPEMMRAAFLDLRQDCSLLSQREGEAGLQSHG